MKNNPFEKAFEYQFWLGFRTGIIVGCLALTFLVSIGFAFLS